MNRSSSLISSNPITARRSRRSRNQRRQNHGAKIMGGEAQEWVGFHISRSGMHSIVEAKNFNAACEQSWLLYCRGVRLVGRCPRRGTSASKAGMEWWSIGVMTDTGYRKLPQVTTGYPSLPYGYRAASGGWISDSGIP